MWSGRAGYEPRPDGPAKGAEPDDDDGGGDDDDDDDGVDDGADNADNINGVSEKKIYIQSSLQRDENGRWPMANG